MYAIYPTGTHRRQQSDYHRMDKKGLARASEVDFPSVAFFAIYWLHEA